ncbi:hypothetical protein NDU88_007193 [Pleurodeles waltl]|uniref:Uncharacterized protein n=1 Tax=Pleurodeles waltl TaxID=8319 RepID=A0AAV7LTX3_PLEWA|nr:hypothetical protein NDU88_007193 [Pleurodeles waltl]
MGGVADWGLQQPVYYQLSGPYIGPFWPGLSQVEEAYRIPSSVWMEFYFSECTRICYLKQVCNQVKLWTVFYFSECMRICYLETRLQSSKT